MHSNTLADDILLYRYNKMSTFTFSLVLPFFFRFSFFLLKKSHLLFFIDILAFFRLMTHSRKKNRVGWGLLLLFFGIHLYTNHIYDCALASNIQFITFTFLSIPFEISNGNDRDFFMLLVLISDFDLLSQSRSLSLLRMGRNPKQKIVRKS